MSKTVNKEWLIAARSSLENAKRELVYAARAFERAHADAFKPTIKEIKATIGDLEMSIAAINEFDT